MFLEVFKLLAFRTLVLSSKSKDCKKSAQKKPFKKDIQGSVYIGVFLIGVLQGNAQTQISFTLDDCYQQAQTNYPLVKKRTLIKQSEDFSIENAAKGYLPQFSVNGQATYQSAVTTIPIAVPGIDIPQLDKDQYKVYGELTQSIYDGGETKQRKALQHATAAIEEQSLSVSLYQLKERVHQLFFGILLIEAQLHQHGLLIKDIDLGLAKTQGAIDHGTALRSSADVLKAEKLKAEQQSIDLKATRIAYLEMLSLFLNRALDTNTVLIKPQPAISFSEIKRPELDLYDHQLERIDVQEKTIEARNRPKFDFFFQGGYGRPALNMLKPNFEAYYIGGFRMRWNLANLYISKNEKAILENDRLSIDADKETFLFNIQSQMKQESASMKRYQALLQSDDEIISLRERVKNAALAQLEYGVMTTSDYLREVNAADQARVNKSIHEIQLLSSQYSHQNTTGN
ncbi:TolC family protein [Olivibacter ginsenosidimutans]|uniref:TolC family protein n=1 Tax=Olivibacter ginsenosidimutans TaxID=1176537 RepID=A0ABP9BC07_9SPHI